MAWWQWSLFASDNASADPTINFAEGQSPSSVNDSARALMARAAEYRDDSSGKLVTTGTSTAYVLTTNQGLNSVPEDGQLLAFTMHTTNDVNPQLTVDGGTTYPLQVSPGVPASSATLIEGTPYTVKFSLADLAWILRGFFGNPNIIGIGDMIDTTNPVLPNSNYVFPYGQAISRTVYATYFGMVGTTYGVGDGVTTFNIIDMRGRLRAAPDNMGGTPANRLTSAGSGVDGSTIGAAGGAETITLDNTMVPNLAVSVSGNITPTTGGFQLKAPNIGTAAAPLGGTGSATFSAVGFLPADTLTVNSAGNTTNGGGQPHHNVQPTIVVPVKMRII